MTAGKSISVEIMALRIVRELVPGTVVNLGTGLGFHVANFVRPESGIILHAENGLFGFGAWHDGNSDPDAALFGQSVEILPGAASLDHVASFGLIRTGRIHTTVLGAFEVDEHGRAANWMAPGKTMGGIGGAMELLRYCPRVILAMHHLNSNGTSKVRRRCAAPLGSERVVDLIVTDLAVLKPTGRGALRLLEIAPGLTVAEVQECTEATLEIPGHVPYIAC